MIIPFELIILIIDYINKLIIIHTSFSIEQISTHEHFRVSTSIILPDEVLAYAIVEEYSKREVICVLKKLDDILGIPNPDFATGHIY